MSETEIHKILGCLPYMSVHVSSHIYIHSPHTHPPTPLLVQMGTFLFLISSTPRISGALNGCDLKQGVSAREDTDVDTVLGDE